MGRVLRPHGLAGETIVKLTSNRAERTVPGARFDTETGALVVEEIRPYQGRWLVRFEGVASRSAADALRGTVLLAPALRDDDALWVHELIGAVVVRHGSGAVLGTVSSVLANPASDLLELDTGVLVPVRFVLEHAPGRVVVDVPEGLAE